MQRLLLGAALFAAIGLMGCGKPAVNAPAPVVEEGTADHGHSHEGTGDDHDHDHDGKPDHAPEDHPIEGTTAPTAVTPPSDAPAPAAPAGDAPAPM